MQEMPIKISKNYVRIFGNSQQFCNCCIDINDIRNEVSDLPISFGAMFCSKNQKTNCENFCWHFSAFISVETYLLGM